MWQATAPFPDRRRGPIDLLDGAYIKQQIPSIKAVKQGVLNIFVRGHGAALSVNENCDPTVRSDMTEALLRLLPRRPAASAAADNARALLMSPSLTLPVEDGRLSFGTWQGVYFARHSTDASGDLVFTLCEGTSQAGFTFNANKRQSHSITSDIDKALREPASLSQTVTAPPAEGSLLVHEKHTSASVSLAGSDLEPAMREIVPERWNDEFFEHTMEGPDDMPGHMKSTLLGCGVMVPMNAGCASLGDGQQVMLNEHRDCGGWGNGHHRSIQVTQLAAACQHVLSLSASSASTWLTDITADLRTAASSASPGLLHVFAASPTHGVLVGNAAAVETLATSLSALTADSRARAAICKNGLCVPLGKDGRLLLGEGQGVWLYYGGDVSQDAEAARAMPTVVATLHSSQL